MRNETIRRALAAVGATALAAMALAGCGSNDGSGGGAQSGGKTQLTWFMWSGSDAEVKAWKHVGDMVTAKYPEITLKWRTATFADYWTKLAAEASGGDAPCVLGLQSQRTPGFGNLLKPMTTDMLSKNDVDLGQFDESIVKGLQVDGKQMAIPYDLGPYLIFYNKTMMKKAGVPLPKPGWTKDDFLSAAKKLTGGGKYGFAAFPVVDWALPFATSVFGVNPVSEGGTVDLKDPKFVSAMQWYVDLVQKEKVAPSVPATNDGGWPINQFLSGNAAMVVDGPWDLVNAKAQAKFDLGLAPMPSDPGGIGTVSAGSGFGVAASCTHPDEAMKAVSVLTGPEALQYLGEQGRAFPARTAQQKFWYEKAVPGAQPALDAAAKSAKPFLTTAKWNQLSQLFQQYGVQALNGQQPVSTWLDNVQQQAGG